MIRTMPIWGLSALAAGSVGPAMSDPRQANIVHRATPASESGGLPPSNGAKLMLAKSPHIEIKLGLRRTATKAFAVGPARSVFANNSAVARLDEKAVDAARALTEMSAAAAAAAHVTIAATSTVATDLPASIAISHVRPTETVDAMQVGSLKPASSKMAAAMLPKISSDHFGARMQPANSRAIYGTSALNAYKVYYPQDELLVAGKQDISAAASAMSTELDPRVLTRRGSYLFYEAASEVVVADKIKTEPAAENMRIAKGMIERTAPTGKSAETIELTSPVLQKQPLNFGDGVLEKLPQQGTRTAAVTIGESNADERQERRGQ